MPLDFATTYAALHDGVAARLAARDVVFVDGPDALSYLQGQCTQDLDGIEPAESRDALLLSPQGKFEAAIRVTAFGEDRMLVDCRAGFGDLVRQRLARFKLRVRVTLDGETWRAIELRGPGATAYGTAPAASVMTVEFPGWSGVDLLGPAVTLPEDLGEGDGGAFEVTRIEAGWPEMGTDLTERTIPQEADLIERTVSLSKGCYTGQELVARLDARGNNVARHLRGLVISVGNRPDLLRGGETISVGGAEMGGLTSTAWSPLRDAVVALGYVRRSVSVPAEGAVVANNGEELPATIVALPIGAAAQR